MQIRTDSRIGQETKLQFKTSCKCTAFDAVLSPPSQRLLHSAGGPRANLKSPFHQVAVCRSRDSRLEPTLKSLAIGYQAPARLCVLNGFSPHWDPDPCGSRYCFTGFCSGILFLFQPAHLSITSHVLSQLGAGSDATWGLDSQKTRTRLFHITTSSLVRVDVRGD